MRTCLRWAVSWVADLSAAARSNKCRPVAWSWIRVRSSSSLSSTRGVSASGGYLFFPHPGQLRRTGQMLR